MKTRLLILIPIVIISIAVGMVTYLDYSKLTTPINGIPLINNNPELVKRILDLCNSTGVKLSKGLVSSNGTHTIDNNTCEWQTIEKYESDRELNFILSICEHTIRSIEDEPASWSNATYYINTDECVWWLIPTDVRICDSPGGTIDSDPDLSPCIILD